MIIYLPFADFELSAQALDTRRLGNQRKDAFELLEALLSNKESSFETTLVDMWRGYESALANYNIALSKEIDRRGYVDDYYYETFLLMNKYALSFLEAKRPHWLGNESIHSSHRSALKREVTQTLAKTHYALKNQATMNFGLSEDELKERVLLAEAEFNWYDEKNWSDSTLIPLAWPKK